MKRSVLLLGMLALCSAAGAQDLSGWLTALPQTKDYVQKRVSSYDRSGGNADYSKIAPRDTLVLLDEAGPGIITHI